MSDSDVFAAVHVCSGALVGLDPASRHRVLHALTALLDLASSYPRPKAYDPDPLPEPARSRCAATIATLREETPPAAAPKGRGGEKRALILEDLRRHPGAGPRAIARATGLGDAIVGWHLRRLAADGVVRASGSGNRVTYHVTSNDPTAPHPQPNPRRVTAQHADEAILAYLRANGPSSPKAVYVALGMSRCHANARIVDLYRRRVLTRTGVPGSRNVRYAVWDHA